MKKIVALLILAFAIGSCSTDRGVIAQKNSATGLSMAELETIYFQMVSSEEYKQLDAAENAYFEKLNYNNSHITISSTDLNDGALKWIKKNLPYTKFASLDEAKAEYENILALTGEVTKNHRAWYAAYGNKANHKNLRQIMQNYENNPSN